MNHLTLAGHLGSDPEVRYTSSGTKVTTFRVATNSRRGGKDETTWWRITVWGEQFDKLMPHLKKGSAVIISGEMTKAEIYTDRDGNPQMSLNVTANSIQFSPFGRGERSGEQRQQYQQQPPVQQQAPQEGYFNEQTVASGAGAPPSGQLSDEEIPF